MVKIVPGQLRPRHASHSSLRKVCDEISFLTNKILFIPLILLNKHRVQNAIFPHIVFGAWEKMMLFRHGFPFFFFAENYQGRFFLCEIVSSCIIFFRHTMGTKISL